ncbi:MAG: DUF5666 domain-containing protein [Zoogloea sp.]|uniref:DUF5666 domain-containing protein n=1 Tax=Zoogloea sp. TaxID=49181 RepID=UPI0026184E6E|nr:DUF5666 domain-containing protein [Zoogloea sp.]MDD2987502.1 DUF5666 domain-containing protein [Zoogloea sp.]
MKACRSPSAAVPRGLTVLLAAVIFLVSACGGGGATDLAGVGSGGSGVASGAVTGFGSVIVEGVEYDDSAATRQAEDASGAVRNVAVKLGQRVRVVYSGARAASSIEVQAQLLGPVTRVPGADGVLQVLGQPVRIVTGSNDATRSNPTVLDGFATPAAIQLGSEVEVHGAWAYDSVQGVWQLVATRLERLATAPDPVLLGGVVSALEGSTLRLNAATGTRVDGIPAGRVSLGETVRVWVARSGLAATPLVALRVAGSEIRSGDLDAASGVSLSGLASGYDAASRTVVVQGLRVKLADGVHVDEAALARGEFVCVELSRAGGTLLASSVKQRGSSDLGRTTEVKGVTRGIDWNAASVAFTLRGTAIQADATAIDASCRAVNAASDVYVEVRGSLAASGGVVSAASVRCSQSYSGSASADYEGRLESIDTVNRSLSLRVSASGALLAARWDARTYFEQHPASLSVGLRVEVEGVMDQGSSTLRLTRVRLAD